MAQSEQEWVATVIDNQNVATFTKELIVQLPNNQPIKYLPGSYLKIHVPPFKTNTSDWKSGIDPIFYEEWEKHDLFNKEIDFRKLPNQAKEIVKPFSLASYPAEGNTLRFDIRISFPPIIDGKVQPKTPWGLSTSYAFSLKKGDKIKISGPYGESFMKSEPSNLYFLIAGAGASFARSHILHLFLTEKTKRHVELWYGARTLKDVIYKHEFDSLADNQNNFFYHVVLSEPILIGDEDLWPIDDPVKTNLLYRAFELGKLQKLKTTKDCLFLVCGPHLHNQAVLQLLNEYGVDKKQIIVDDFGI